MIKLRLLVLTLVSALAFCSAAYAQPGGGKGGDRKGGKAAAPKGPADVALEEFGKLVFDRTAKQDQARFQKVIASGIAFLSQYGDHKGATEVVQILTEYGTRQLSEKTVRPLRAVYTSALKVELLNVRYKEGLSPDSKAAFAAAEAALLDAQLRDSDDRRELQDNITTLREKIDALAQLPSAGRFLPDREWSYYQILAKVAPARAEAHMQALAKSPDKILSDMGQLELNTIELKKTPTTLSFTALDGKPVDLAQLRGKIIVLYFWSANNGNSTRHFEALKSIASEYKKNLEIVTVAVDKEEDRAKVQKVVKDGKLAWPVYFDGKGAQPEFAAKFNIARMPAAVLFDAKGLFVDVANNVQPAQIEGVVRNMLGMKPKAAAPPPQEEMPQGKGGGGGKRR